MLVVHDVVAGLEVVVVVLAATRTARAAVHAPPTGEVGFGDEREVCARQHDTAFERRDQQAHRARRRLARAGVETFAGEDVAQALRGTGAFGGEHDAVALTRERAQATGERVGITDDGVERAGGDARRVGTVGRRQHRHRAGPGVREQPVELQREARQVAFASRAPGDGEGGRQRRLFVEQFLRPVAHALRLDEQHQRVVREEVGQQVLAVGEPRQPRLHAVEQLALGQALPLLAAPRLLRDQRGRPRPHVVGGEQLARREDARFGDVVGGALVGHRERRQPVDFVAPQIDAHGMVVGRRVHVDDRPPHRDLAARLHLVLASVAAGHQPGDEVVAVDLVARLHDDRFDLLGVRTEPLHQRAHRRHDDLRRCRRPVRRGPQPPHHAQATAHRLERRRHPLERQRLPRREELDLTLAEELGEVAHEAFGLGTRRHRQQQRTTAGDPGERRHEQRPCRVGHRHRGLSGDHRAQRRLLGEERGESSERGRGGGHETRSKPGATPHPGVTIVRVSSCGSWRRRRRRR